MVAPGASLVDMLDSIRADMVSAGASPTGAGTEVHLAIDHHNPDLAISLQGAYTDDMLKEAASCVRTEFLIRLLSLVSWCLHAWRAH